MGMGIDMGTGHVVMRTEQQKTHLHGMDIVQRAGA